MNTSSILIDFPPRPAVKWHGVRFHSGQIIGVEYFHARLMIEIGSSLQYRERGCLMRVPSSLNADDPESQPRRQCNIRASWRMNGFLVMAHGSRRAMLFLLNWVGWVTFFAALLYTREPPHSLRPGQHTHTGLLDSLKREEDLGEARRKKNKREILGQWWKIKSRKRSSLFSWNVLLDPLTLLLFITSLFLAADSLSR